jgi:ribosome-binding protein aMBF1 (putative translation factor)
LINAVDSDIVVDSKMGIRLSNDQQKRHLAMAEAMIRQRTYSKYAQEAALLLGQQIKLARKQRQWSEMNLAERVGISRATLQKIEGGEMTCAIGLVFEVATLVGINLFEQDKLPLSIGIDQTKDKIALLPRRIQPRTKAVDDDF